MVHLAGVPLLLEVACVDEVRTVFAEGVEFSGVGGLVISDQVLNEFVVRVAFVLPDDHVLVVLHYLPLLPELRLS